MIDIRLPNITATDEAGQLQQMRSYLYQFSEQLQWALNTLEKGTSAEEVVLKNALGEAVEKTEEAKAQDTFNSIKDLIIKSADIVEAYYEEIDNLLSLSGNYVAQADFGSGGVAQYIKDTNMSISATSEALTQKFTKTETINGEVVKTEYSLDDIDQRIQKQEGTIRSGFIQVYIGDNGGLLDSPREVTGIEVGEISTTTGVARKRYATFSAYGIELYGDSTTTLPVAYITKSKLHILSAEFSGYVRMGKYRLDLSNGIAFKWEEG